MHVLPKRIDIDRAKANERKIEIDSGVALSKRIESLRETRLTEEKNLKEWRESAIKSVQYDIDQRIEERDNLDKQIDDARKLRTELLKPLDEEWVKIDSDKKVIAKEKENIKNAKESLKTESKKLSSEIKKVSDIVSKVKQKDSESEKNRKELVALKDMAQKEYEIARDERDIQTEKIERENIAIQSIKEQYEVGIKTNEQVAKKNEEGRLENEIERKRLVDLAETLNRSKEEITRRELNK